MKQHFSNFLDAICWPIFPAITGILTILFLSIAGGVADGIISGAGITDVWGMFWTKFGVGMVVVIILVAVDALATRRYHKMVIADLESIVNETKEDGEGSNA